ncbi:hypothetical protein [Tenacibaculum sp. M341]|uniref:hypothetical protein n=1 Tax=Tenacibaculum sp. M341 TaxID=2530339 RepID=UPI00104464E2|nr:hypothetical protein [Tenacibaculum sp. M341]TCI84997.1 hypothetical protein EYW44_18415 [Tenacibaculum sp. M341]
MKMRKGILVITLLVSIFTYSQTGFIEVEVRDSIKLKASKYEYLIEITQNNDYLYSNDNTDVIATRKKIKEKTVLQKKEIEAFLKEKNYKYRFPENLYLINNNSLFDDKSFVITVFNSSEINKLRTDFKQFDYINIRLIETLYEPKDEGEAEKRLFKKLIKKATEKASMIAALSGLKLGKIIEFKEVKEIDNLTFNIMDVYAMSKRNNNSTSLVHVDSKAIVVKFAAK